MKRCIYALLFLILIFSVTDYNTRTEAQYRFSGRKEKQAFLRGKIINHSKSPQAVNLAVKELLLLPDRIWENFFKNGGNIIITKRMPVEDAVGTFSNKDLSYFIYVSPDYIEYALLHEVGHYVDYAQGIKNDSGFQRCMDENSKALNGVLENNFYFCQSSEYFAEMFKLYFHGQLNSKDYPIFVKYIEKKLEKYR